MMHLKAALLLIGMACALLAALVLAESESRGKFNVLEGVE